MKQINIGFEGILADGVLISTTTASFPKITNCINKSLEASPKTLVPLKMH